MTIPENDAISSARAGPAGARRRRPDVSRAVAFAAIVAVIVWLAMTGQTSFRPKTAGGQAIALSFAFDLVSHAGAGLPAARYSNSRQALDAAFERGIRKIEVDLMLTSDDRIVATHDWTRVYRELHPGNFILPAFIGDLLPPAPPNHASFMEGAIAGDLDPVDLDYLVGWLNKHPAERIVTDVKSDNVALLRRLAAYKGLRKEQVIPQIYHREELAPVRDLGYGEVIYTLYREHAPDFVNVIQFAKRNDIAVTMPGGLVTPAVARKFRAEGVPLYIHTINRPEQAAALKKAGVTGVYTDFLTPVPRAGVRERQND